MSLLARRDYASGELRAKLERQVFTALQTNATPGGLRSEVFERVVMHPHATDQKGRLVLGHVTKGMAIVRKIQKSPAKDQTLTPPIEIVSIARMP